MFKRKFLEISEDEKRRILNLHESVSKKLITENVTEDPMIIKFNYNFPTGTYSDSFNPKLKEEINKILPQIEKFIGTNTENDVEIEVEVGESAVTNADNEHKDDKGKGTVVPAGWLATERGKTIQKILQDLLGQLKAGNFIANIPKITPTVGKQKYTYDKNKDNPKDSKYLEDQYVKFIIKVKSSCIANVTITVAYDYEAARKSSHSCDEAQFQIYANGVLLTSTDGKPYADLNNGELNPPFGGFRKSVFYITDAIAKDILKKDPNQIVLMSVCLPSPRGYDKKPGTCHDEVPHVWIQDKTGGYIVSPFFPSDTQKGQKNKILCVLDKCGKLIKS